ncbi:hypothetical protein F3Y22_tig00112491pilonHSYRG00238 [Hibiscus syriacus]|uniref:PH domain-containing protein n=1 Tax=Hibiscus syriacus TaxID=106335 RepID=A0A6A2Y7A2_HIBSY|nr:hypothetical protein F3Y22_tig00112491pilonHSYRG00238 [Hibiscus syriacus]
MIFLLPKDDQMNLTKAETSEDLYKWNAALEKALSQPTSSAGDKMASVGMIRHMQLIVLRNQPERSTVLHRPILLALEDVDGAPTFLEKALRFVEEHGKTEFSQDEDAHVVADCVKYVIRELASSPVPASYCNALLETCRKYMLDNPYRVKFLYSELVGLLWRPARHPYFFAPFYLVTEIETDFDVGADAQCNCCSQSCSNHFMSSAFCWQEGCVSSDLYSDSEEIRSESEEEADDDDESYEDDEREDESQGSDDDNNSVESGTGSESGQSVKSGDDKDSESSSSSSATETNKPDELSKGVHGVTKLEDASTRHTSVSSATEPPVVGNGPGHHVRHSTVRGRSSVSMGFTDLPCEEEAAVESLESEKLDLQKRLTEEIEGNTTLEASFEKRKKTLQEQRLALEKEFAKTTLEDRRRRIVHFHELLRVADDDLRLSCLSSSSNDMLEEHASGGSVDGKLGGLVGEKDILAPEGGNYEKLDLGAGVMIPLRLGDLDICFLAIAAGSCRGNQHEYFMSWMILRCSTMVFMVGLSDGSIWRHLCAMSATVRTAFIGNRP